MPEAAARNPQAHGLARQPLRLSRSTLHASGLPLVIEPAGGMPDAPLAQWIGALASELPRLNAELQRHGALLLRGFPIADAGHMEQVVSLFGGELLDYTGGAVPRSRVQGRVFNSTELNRRFRIRIHNELSYQRRFPRLVSFFCETPSATGGETIVADCRKVLHDIPPEIVAEFRRRGVRYTRVFQDTRPRRELVKKLVPTYFHMTWQQVFGTGSRAEVEAACARLEMHHAWRPDGGLEVSNVLDAVADHAGTGEEVWFSHLNLFYPCARVLGAPVHLSRKLIYRRLEDTPNQVSYGDGAPIPRAVAMPILDAVEKHTVAFAWRRGDLMVVDNRLVGHGRNPYSGDRRVLVAMHA